LGFENKVVVIVGGASEMAAATYRAFIEKGASVVLIDCDEQTLEQTAETCAQKQRLSTYCADIRDFEEVQSVFDNIIHEQGQIDALLNCAGIIKHSPIDVMSPSDWQSVLDTNLTGIFNTCKAVTPYMKDKGSGRIVNISSIGGRTARPGVGVNYAASKAGIIGLSQALARELANWNITVNVVAPGPLNGRMFNGMRQELIDELQSSIPLKRLGEMSDIVPAILYLFSDEASWITGEVIDINGGLFI